MVKTYDLLAPLQEQVGHWSVSLLPKPKHAPKADAPLFGAKSLIYKNFGADVGLSEKENGGWGSF